MSELLRLEDFALRSDGSTLTMSVSSGSIIGLYGNAGGGKSEFLNVIADEIKPARGSVHLRCQAAKAEALRIRRLKPIQLARTGKSAAATSLATEALLATHLWEVRSKPVSTLSVSQQAASELLTMLTSEAQLMLIDMQLDALDPWTLKSVLAHIRKLRSHGVSAIIATNRLDLLKHLDHIVVFENRAVRFAGNGEDLLRLRGSHQFTVTANDQPGALALVSPFAISVEERQNELRFHATEGQEIAARLLLEGYGNVTLVVNRPPSLEEALLSLLR
jgi:ABC-type multidrug transport system ATPase subunit